MSTSHSRQSSLEEASASEPKAKKQKILACARCRHRKQKCSDTRPCDNCTKSRNECVPSDSAALGGSRPNLESNYIQILEQRVADLEALIPQESLDHIGETPRNRETEPRAISRSAESHQGFPPPPISQSSPISFRSQLAITNNIAPRANSLSSLVFGNEENDSNFDSLGLGFLAVFVNLHDGDDPSATEFARQAALGNPSVGNSVVKQSLDERSLTLRDEDLLIQTYLNMAHCQYPFLYKQQLLSWVDQWRIQRNQNLVDPLESWKGFFVNMVFAVAFLLSKSPMHGLHTSQALYTLAITKYLPSVFCQPNRVLHAQAYLLLSMHALHSPSTEKIIAISSSAIRYCIMAQLHLVETEPERTDAKSTIEIQIRRRVFWCAFALDRAVCSSYDLSLSIVDDNITAPKFANLDDDDLPTVATETPLTTDLPSVPGHTCVSSALHIIRVRQIESEILSTTLHQNFTVTPSSNTWQSQILGKLNHWASHCKSFSRSSLKGYVSVRWLAMIYNYNLVMLYRPTRSNVTGMAGDWSVQACSQALLMFRRFQMGREISQPWLGLVTQFQIGITLLYCFYATPPHLRTSSYRQTTISDAIRACSNTLAVLADRWHKADCLRDVFEILARSIPISEHAKIPERLPKAGASTILELLGSVRAIVVHRWTMSIIEEMAREDFPACVRDPREVTSGLMDTESGNVVGGASGPGTAVWNTNSETQIMDASGIPVFGNQSVFDSTYFELYPGSWSVGGQGGSMNSLLEDEFPGGLQYPVSFNGQGPST